MNAKMTTTRNGSESFQKLKTMMHVVCAMATNPNVLGRIKLNKVPWYADTFSLVLHGKPITGEHFIKRQFGPVPGRFTLAEEKLVEEGKIKRSQVMTRYNMVKDEFVSLEEPDAAVFSGEEMRLIQAAFEHVCLRNTARSISEETHDDIWELAKIGDEIPLHTVFAAELEELTERDIEWAKAQLAAA